MRILCLLLLASCTAPVSVSPSANGDMVAGAGKNWDARLRLNECNYPPKQRGFVVAGQSNANRIDMDVFEAQLTGDFVTAKVSAGSSGMAVKWLPTALGGPGETMQLLRDQLSSMHPTGTRAIIWIQGEKDANPTDAPHYLKRMRAWITEVRELTNPCLRIIIVALHNESEKTQQPTIRATQEYLAANDPLISLVTADDLTIADGMYDGLHYTLGPTLGAEQLSIRVGLAAEAIP